MDKQATMKPNVNARPLTECIEEVIRTYYEVLRSDSHGAALHAATMRGRELGLTAAKTKQIIG